MADADEWPAGIPMDTSDDVHVMATVDDIYIFYTEDLDEYVRTDTVVNIPSNR